MPVIEDFGEKLRELEGIVGFAFPGVWFDNKFLAERFRIREEQMTRRKTGKAAVQEHELSRLVELFGLGPELDYSLFLMPVDAFRRALHTAKIGTFGLDGGGLLRQRLLSDPNRSKSGISVKRLPRGVLRGGLGLSESGQSPVARLWVGDRATIGIEVPGPGHLLVLSDSLRGEITCLMPSCFCPDTAVAMRRARIPAAETGYDGLDVAPPAGWYRLISIWTPTALTLPRFAVDLRGAAPLDLLPEELRLVCQSLDGLAAEGRPYEIRTVDYFVAE